MNHTEQPIGQSALAPELVPPLLYWYQMSARQLPWRKDPTPYHVWISEIMLQQTRVEAVKPYYDRFIRTFPTPEALAEADDTLLMKLWEGLGYYSRARNLKKAAIILTEQYDGAFPKSVRELKKLPGIGDYTAGAIASIAFGLPEPAVDGNVLRVAARLTADPRDILRPDVKNSVREALRLLYPPDEAGASSLTQALMELGALVCLPNGAPLCGDCPLSGLCLAHRQGLTDAIPFRSPRAARTVQNRTVLLLCHNGCYAIQQRPPKGLLASLWEFPTIEEQADLHTVLAQAEKWGVSPQHAEKLTSARHVFTHLEWHMTGWLLTCDQAPSSFVWATPEQLQSTYAIPSAFRAFRKYIVPTHADPNFE